MNPEETHLDVSEDGISRRRMLKRIGAGAAVAWSAPILTSIRTPAFAQYPPGNPCDDNAPCDLNLPCNEAIDCQGSGGSCNCWVLSDRLACFCGPLVPCDALSPCGPGDTCPTGQVCVENCCGKLCYVPCELGSSRAPKGAGRAYGVRPS
jgi:hypothetical protein